jgi:hypothetical protein
MNYGSLVNDFIFESKKNVRIQESSKSVPRGELVRFVFSLQITGCTIEIRIFEE